MVKNEKLKEFCDKMRELEKLAEEIGISSAHVNTGMLDSWAIVDKESFFDEWDKERDTNDKSAGSSALMSTRHGIEFTAYKD